MRKRSDNFYVQRKVKFHLETVAGFHTLAEANDKLKECQLAEPTAKYYVSTWPCTGWKGLQITYIQRQNGWHSRDTVDQFDTREEALAVLAEYERDDPDHHYYLSCRPCEDWRIAGEPA